MKTGAFILTFVLFFTLPAVVFTGAFKVYPGAKLEEVYEASQSETGAKMSKSPKVISSGFINLRSEGSQPPSPALSQIIPIS